MLQCEMSIPYRLFYMGRRVKYYQTAQIPTCRESCGFVLDSEHRSSFYRMKMKLGNQGNRGNRQFRITRFNNFLRSVEIKFLIATMFSNH